MTELTLGDLQESVRDRTAFKKLGDYQVIGSAYLALLQAERPTRIVSPTQPNYVFYQYDQTYGHKITRPLNTDLFTESATSFKQDFDDKYLLTKLLGRDIPVVAVFLHDVQRARRGNSIFGINTTFKSNHFLGYTVALNRLDGVYYVDPRPEMLTNQRLREQIYDFQQFLIRDLWVLTR